jgi:hypothetical protein
VDFAADPRLDCGANPIKECPLPAARHRAKFLVLLVAVVGLGVVLSACAFLKEGSLSLSQPGGIGAARVHFVLCTIDEKGDCGPNEFHEFGETVQYLVGIAVPKGSAPPATFTAQPTKGGAGPIVFSKNDQVAAELAASSSKFLAELSEEEREKSGLKPWPPAGLEGVGYLSAPVQDSGTASEEWAIDADFGLPTGPVTEPFTGPFATGIAMGIRQVNASHPGDSPVHCLQGEGEMKSLEEGEAICLPTLEEGQIGTSNLTIGAPVPAPVFVGGKATLPFSLNFASTATSLPSFTVGATTTLPGATASVPAPSFTPAATDATTHRSTGSENVTVAVPTTAKPGVYEVTITATTPQGGTATQVAKYEVTKPKLKLGKVKLNKKNGTAKLSIGVPSAGTLTVSGKGIVKVQRKPVGPKTLKITIKAKGKAKTKLASTGKAKVKAKIVFKPSNGASVTKTKSLVLKKKLAG